VLSRLGLAAGQIPGKPGVWLQANVASRCPRCRPEDRKKPGKIAEVDLIIGPDGITRQGFTLNINPDMELIESLHEHPQIEGPFVSLEDIFPETPEMKMIKKITVQSLSELFNFQVKHQLFDFLD
ncbi:MAG: hypothetical protein WCP19_03065, partial [Chloroflexota bacterium]